MPRTIDSDAFLRRYARVVEERDQRVRRELAPCRVPFSEFEPDHPYWNYPLLFRDTFADIEAEPLGRLAVAARWISAAVLHADAVVDAQRPGTAELHVHAELTRRAHRELSLLLPAHSPFWRDLERYAAQFLSSQHLEESVRGGSRPAESLGEQDQRSVAAGKAALGKLVPAAMAALSDRAAHLQPIERSYDLYNMSHQLYDDLLDWKEDLRAGRPSWLLWRIARAHALPSAKAPVDDWRRVLHGGGFAAAALRESDALLDEARAAVTGIPAAGWTRFLDREAARTRQLRADLLRIGARGGSE